ncbi:MAG TPA: helix-turn-helix domain-containing protein [Pirellulales bacterium]
MSNDRPQTFAEYRGLLESAIEEINRIDVLPVVDGEAYLRRCAEIAREIGMAALHVGLVQQHARSLEFGCYCERQEVLTFLSTCLKECREHERNDGRSANPPAASMMTREEVAACLGIHIRTVRRRVLDGTLPEPVQVGRSVRWRREDIEAIVGVS